jgi:outer membrane protein OmpA-like peptidoglycan-associated protein
MQLELPKPLPTRGPLSTPYMYVYVTDQVSHQPIPGARVKIQNTKVRKDRLDKNTDSKYGRVGRGFKPGQYTIEVSHANYSSHEPFEFTHVYDYDTIHIALCSKQPFCWPVVDMLSERRVPAKFELKALDEQDKVEGITDADCRVKGLADKNLGYTLKVNAEGYEPYEQEFKCIPSDDFIIRLKPIQVKTFVLQNMYFATAKTTILTSSKPSLDLLYELLKETPQLVIRIIGHSDDVGSDAVNMKLSQGRANSVKQAMVKRGISSNRIQVLGKGESDPVVANDSEEHRQMNRRVEIEIISGAEDIKIEHILQ